MKNEHNYPAILAQEISLRGEFLKSFPPFLIYLATIIIMLSFFKDLVRVGFHLSWLLIRSAYLPFVLIIWNVSTKKLKTVRYYEAPLWAAGIYITLMCAYFSLATGGIKSDYIFGLIQFYFAIAVMPLTAFTFYILFLGSIAIYIGLNILYLGTGNLHDHAMISTLVPLLVFPIVVYFITSRIRLAKINLQNTLSKTLLEMKETIKIQSEKLARSETKAALGLVVAQVAHDIRSPLAALNMISAGLTQIPEDMRVLIREAISRISDIANNLLNKYKQSDDAFIDSVSPEMVSVLVHSVISEKRIQFQDSNVTLEYLIDTKAQGVFAKLQSIEFKRMISNLINNGIESIVGKGKVEVVINADNDFILIEIKDNGCGISADTLKKLFHEGGTTKENGMGLGLVHAKKTINLLNGYISITSELNLGTLLSLKIPKCSSPVWFAPIIKLNPNSQIIVIDDDSSISSVWQSRFAPFLTEHNLGIIHFSSIKRFKEWYEDNVHNISIYLFDYEFIGASLSGLDIIEQLRISDTSYLVTSRYEDLNIRQRCENMSLPLIPKEFAPYIPICIESAKKINPDLIFIDDDKILTNTWAWRGKEMEKNIMTFNSIDEFKLSMIHLDEKDLPIYIDSDLGGNISGQDYAKELFKKGFVNIYLCTGYAENYFGDMPWIKGVVGKEPPF